MHEHSGLPDDLADARARAAKALRDVGHAFVGHHLPIEQVDHLTTDLTDWLGRIDRERVRDRVIERPTGDWGPPPASGEEMFSFDERPVSGRASPYGFDLRVLRDGDEVVAHVTLGSAHEGAPGRCHGGIVSALFDDVFGFVLTVSRQPAFTGQLTVRYERGVPIHEALQCRVRATGTEGRKIHMTGELTGHDGNDGHTVYTRASAIFIAIDPEVFRATAG